MDILLIICILSIIIGTVITKKNFVIICSLFLIGLFIMVLAGNLYLGIVANTGSEPIRSGYVSNLVNSMFKELRISDTKCISLAGELIILVFFILQSAIISKKKILFTAAVIPLVIYAFISHPNTAYKYFLLLNSAGEAEKDNIIFAVDNLSILKSSIVIFFFVLPYVLSIKKYVTTIITPLKRFLLSYNILMIATQVVFLLFISSDLINNVFIFDVNIFYRGNINTTSVYRSIPVLIYIIIGVMSVITAVLGKKMNNYAVSSRPQIFDRSPEIEKTLKSALHTYKNMFFAIKSQSELIFSEDSNVIERTNEITNIANKALYMTTKQLDMLNDLEISLDDISIKDVIDSSVELALVPSYIDLSISYNTAEELIHSDSLLLTELFSNLIRNACTAVEKTTKPEIRINVLSEDNWLVVEICDNGYGIEKKYIKKIFKPLVSVHQGIENWGIGLYYAGKIVTAFNGHIYAMSNPNEMTKFQVFLPINTHRNKAPSAHARGGQRR